jgi:hypothetical protein
LGVEHSSLHPVTVDLGCWRALVTKSRALRTRFTSTNPHSQHQWRWGNDFHLNGTTLQRKLQQHKILKIGAMKLVSKASAGIQLTSGNPPVGLQQHRKIALKGKTDWLGLDRGHTAQHHRKQEQKAFLWCAAA